MKDLKIIKIIISSSIEDIESDILEVKAFFGTLNDIYIDWNIFFSIETAAPDSDESLLESIGGSELAFLLFYKKVGETFRHTFEKAVDMYKNSDKPLIIPYFKYANSTDDVSEDIKKLQDHLGNDLKHYYKSYNNPDTLKLYMIMQIKQMQLDALPFEIKGGVIKFAGKDLVPADSIPAFANNKHLKELKEKLAEINEKFVKLKAEYLSDPDNEKLEEEYSCIASERSQLRKEIEKHEETLLESIRTIIKETTKGGLSQRQIEGYKLMESGDYEGALEILNYDDIMSDLDRNTSMASAFIENIQINANELSQRISALEGKGVNSETAEEIRKIYEKLHDLIGNYGALDKDPLYEYAKFLLSQNDHEKAIEIAEECLFFAKESKNDAELAVVYNLLGVLYKDTQQYKEAEKAYLKSKEINERLTAKDPDIFEYRLAVVYNNLGNLYIKTQRLQKAEEAYLKSKEINERLTAKDPDAFECYLADSYNNLGILYIKTQMLQKAKKALLKSKEIYERLAQNNPDAFEPYLANSYDNIGNLYDNTKRYKESKEAHLKSNEIYERLAQNNPDAFEPDLARSYNNIGKLYDHTKRYKESKEAHLKSNEIYERLAKKNPDAFEPDLANSYNNIGVLYNNTKRYKESEEAYFKALEIRKRLAEKKTNAFESDLADSYNNLGALYFNTKKYKEAEEFYLKAAEIYERLVAKDPTAFKLDLENIYDNLLNIYTITQKSKEKNEVLQKKQEIEKKMAQKNPTTHVNMASSYLSRGIWCQNAKKYKEAEKGFRKALEIFDNIAKNNPNDFEVERALACYSLGYLICRNKQRCKEAKKFYLKAAKIYEKLSQKSPDDFELFLADIYKSLGTIHIETQRYKESEEFYLKAEKIYKKLAKKDPNVFEPALANVYFCIGKVYKSMKKIDTAKEFCTSALEIYIKNNKDGKFDSEIEKIRKFLSKL